MAKNIVLCFDGTWNEPKHRTNVTKIFLSILGEDKTPKSHKGPKLDGRTPPPPDQETIKWYDRGVGTSLGNIFRGGLTGRGLSKNILQGYRFLVENYEAQDNIFLFGFSRGAYTARSLVGLIRNIGLLRKEFISKDNLFDNPVLMNGFWMYQRRDSGPKSNEATFYTKKYSIESIDIKFLGVWDTVGAMGIPSNDLDTQSSQYEFHDTTLSSMVKNAYHALAVDETRPEFRPTLWNFPPKEGQTLEQVWFAGVHSEVGGGKKPALTDVPLRWMQENAMANGLELDQNQVVSIKKQDYFNRRVSDHFGSFWKPYRLFAWIKGSRPHRRPIGGTPIECLHDLVLQKIDASNRSYNPPNHGLRDKICEINIDAWECEG